MQQVAPIVMEEYNTTFEMCVGWKLGVSYSIGAGVRYMENCTWKGNFGMETFTNSPMINLDLSQEGLTLKNCHFKNNKMYINSILNVNNPVEYIIFDNVTFEDESKALTPRHQSRLFLP